MYDVPVPVYDDAGRMVSRQVDADAMVLERDVLSKLTSTTGTSGDFLYLYDSSGQRVVKVGTSTATAYFGGTEVTDPDTTSTSTGDVVGTRYYSFGSAVVATRTGNALVNYLFGDVQGSAQVSMTGEADPTEATVTRSAYMPYGQTRGTDGLGLPRVCLTSDMRPRVTALTMLTSVLVGQASAGRTTQSCGASVPSHACHWECSTNHAMSPCPACNGSESSRLAMSVAHCSWRANGPYMST